MVYLRKASMTLASALSYKDSVVRPREKSEKTIKTDFTIIIIK